MLVVSRRNGHLTLEVSGKTAYLTLVVRDILIISSLPLT